jgi:uncharacterized membrane protein
MGHIILTFYVILTCVIFASYRLLRKNSYTTLLFIISLIFLAIECYGILKADIFNLKTNSIYSLFGWLFFLIVVFRLLRLLYLKQRGCEPIITWGHPYDGAENRRATTYDTIFTLLILVASIGLTFLLGFILTRL